MVPKFRAWDKDSKVMRSWKDLILTKDDGDDFWLIGYKENACITSFDHDQTLMQSTGLKDKNGVEVFQGDVVIHEEGEYSYKGIVLKDKYYFYIEGVNINDSFSFDDISNTLIGEADLEVIGNIYENPELLEQADES